MHVSVCVCLWGVCAPAPACACVIAPGRLCVYAEVWASKASIEIRKASIVIRGNAHTNFALKMICSSERRRIRS